MFVYELSDEINHIIMHSEFAEVTIGKTKIRFFHKYFLNKDILLNIIHKAFTFSTCIHEI